MKYIYKLTIIALILSSCSGEKNNSVENLLENGDLKTLRETRGALVNEQQALNDQIKLLDAKIKTMDTTKNVPLITTFKANPEVFNHVLELQGNVTTKDLLTITPEYNGILTNVYVKEGRFNIPWLFVLLRHREFRYFAVYISLEQIIYC